MNLNPLPDTLIEPLVRATLLEDLGLGGDITSNALIPADKAWNAVLKARGAGVIAGLDATRLAFQLFDNDLLFETVVQDGALVASGDVLARVSGSARSILGAERTALNYLSHLSGIASDTRKLVDAAKSHKVRICCTRKTTPNLRALEKYAVLAGGGVNHRMGLDDAILIKDNHIAVCGGLEKAVLAARQAAGHMTKIEVEVDTLEQLDQLLPLQVDVVMLDNMAPDMLKKAVEMVAGRFTTEASGKITLDNVAAIAASGVDVISVGWITHSAPILDIGLDF